MRLTIRKRWRRLARWWVDRPRFDLAAAAVAGAVSWLLTRFLDFDPIAQMGSQARHDWYAVLATLSGTFLGFSVATVGVVFAVAPGYRLRAVLGSIGPQLTGLFFRGLGFLACTSALFAVLAPLDTGTHSSAARYVVPALLVVMMCSVARLLYLFSRVVLVMTRDVAEPIMTGDQPAEVPSSGSITATDYEQPTIRTLAEAQPGASTSGS